MSVQAAHIFIPNRQRVIRVFSVTTGDMLQSPAANQQLWSGLMSDPGYGDLCVINVQVLKRVNRYVLCRLRKRNTRSRTRGNIVQQLPFELLYRTS